MKAILFVICAGMAGVTLEGVAMPTKEAAARAESVVQKLLESEQIALASGRKTRTQVADAAMELAAASDSEAAKMLLMKGAVALYVRDDNLEKAVETMNALEAAISDMPPQCITNIIEWALLGVPKKSGARFYQILDESRGGAPHLAIPSGASGGGYVSAAQKVQETRDSIKSILNGMIKVPGRDYWLSSTELTQGQWEAVMGYNLSQHKGVNLPVENVSRDDCDVFLEKLNQTKEAQTARFEFCLPKLVDWTYAARAGAEGTNCWIRPGVVGDVLDMAWVKENSANETHPVGTKSPNAFGFYDMLGNVWEWMDCEDLTIGCRHGCSFYDPVGDCTVKKGFHTKRSGRYECCGLRLAARVRSVAAESADSAANR